MKILLVGAGTETSKINAAIAPKHSIQAQLAYFAPNHLELFDFDLLVVVSPEASVSIETLVRVAENGKTIFIVAASSDGLASWASGVGVQSYPYPLSPMELNNLLRDLDRAESGGTSAEDVYRRITVGSDFTAALQSQMAARKIVVTSPKGGTGKTTVSVNLATAFALCGITTYLIDADGNAGAIQYHLRMTEMRSSLIGLLRKKAVEKQGENGEQHLTRVASSGTILSSFSPISNLPTLKVLPGLVSDDLGDKVLQNDGLIRRTIREIFDTGVSSGGIVIMDVGINPSHPIHRAALQEAEAIAIVIKPEIPDLAETRRWIAKMIQSLTQTGMDRQEAVQFIKTKVKICYNMVVGDSFKKAHAMLQAALNEDNLGIQITPNGILPMVEPEIAAASINSDRIQDILMWRYKEQHLEELTDFSAALIAFAMHFVPAMREGAERVGLLSSSGKKRNRFWGGR